MEISFRFIAFFKSARLPSTGWPRTTTGMSWMLTETRSGAVKGKVAYMSPEQCTGTQLDRRSDIFSLGIVLYEMSTMTRLFKHPTDFETMTHIVNKDVAPPTSRRADLPRDLETIILRCLAKNPLERFASAAALREALSECESAGRWTAGDAAKWWQVNGKADSHAEALEASAI